MPTSPSRSESVLVPYGNRESTNRILSEMQVAPIKSQSTISLQKQSKSSVRRIMSHFKQRTRAFQSMFRVKRVKTRVSV